MTAEGTYHQLGGFFSRVGSMPRIVNLGDFRLAGIDRPTGTLRAELTLGDVSVPAGGRAAARREPAARRRRPRAARAGSRSARDDRRVRRPEDRP